MRANNLTTSTIFAGQAYVLPSSDDYAASTGAMGQAALNETRTATAPTIDFMTLQAQAIANGAPSGTTRFGGGAVTMTDAPGAQEGLGDRIWNAIGHTTSDIVDAFSHPISGLEGLAKAVPNLVTGTAELLMQGANAEGIAETANSMQLSAAETAQLMGQTRQEIHNFFDNFTLDYSNSAQAGGVAIFNIGTLVVGGAGVVKSGLEGIGALDAASGMARADTALSVPNSVVTRTVGQNSVNYTLDAQGNTLSANGSLLEDFGGGTRSSTEVQAQANAAASGVTGDQGGHLVAYRFLPEQGPINLFPQDANFNVSAFKTVENDYARYVDQGYQVDFEHTLGNFDPITGRPGTVNVDFTVRDSTGSVVDSYSQLFNNAPGQTYVRRVY